MDTDGSLGARTGKNKVGLYILPVVMSLGMAAVLICYLSGALTGAPDTLSEEKYATLDRVATRQAAAKTSQPTRHTLLQCTPYSLDSKG
jgi:hypothetical protein